MSVGCFFVLTFLSIFFILIDVLVLEFDFSLIIKCAGFVLFLSLMIDRLHHYIRELRLLRKTMEAVKKQTRSFEDGKNGSTEEQKALTEEITTLKSKVKKLEAECEAKGTKEKTLETEVEALKKQSEGFLMEYDRLLEDNQNLRSQLEAIDQSSSHLDDKKST